MTNMIGNQIVAAGCVSYVGPFTSTYWENLKKMWIHFCNEK